MIDGIFFCTERASYIFINNTFVANILRASLIWNHLSFYFFNYIFLKVVLELYLCLIQSPFMTEIWLIVTLSDNLIVYFLPFSVL